MSAVSAMLVWSFPIRERCRKCGVYRRGRSPSRGPLDFGRIAIDAPLLGLAQSRFLGVDAHADAAECDQAVEQRSHAALDARADVVGLAGLAAVEQREVGLDDIVDGGEVAVSRRMSPTLSTGCAHPDRIAASWRAKSESAKRSDCPAPM